MYNLSTTLNMKYPTISLSSTSKPILCVFDIITNFFCQENNKPLVESVKKQDSIYSPIPPQKKQKNVKFSKNVKIYYIPPIEEFKECLPNMYWNFDRKEDIFIPLKHMDFVYELNNTNVKTEPYTANKLYYLPKETATCPENKKNTSEFSLSPPPPFTPIIQSQDRPATKFSVCLQTPPPTLPTTPLPTTPTTPSTTNSIINKSFAGFEYKNDSGFPEWINITLTHPPIKANVNQINSLPHSYSYPYPSNEIQNPSATPNFVINQKPNSLPYFFNEFGFNDEIDSLRMSTTPPLFLYEIILQNEIPQMFKGLSCYRLL